ncbi:hypothetical protein C8F04DRAFT_1177200 [Mycena alexandri]|uniref:Uncharacterized protein n=1 Tax=Mycena alexandri TaxID=1745969 RepID=A0AAD6X701_9AGAR|nr:hypothetical protein C8F04DRAFT_1197786 [Mycena alexandri]KAJ7041363.1 hypothetical protein C8F04DRAFT_1177200 [Mycena alexandri]
MIDPSVLLEEGVTQAAVTRGVPARGEGQSETIPLLLNEVEDYDLPRTSPEAPRAMRLAKPLPPPPPPVPYATRPNLAAIPVSNAPAVPFNTGVPSLLRRMEETPLSETSSLLDRLRSPQTQDRNLMRRVDVKLEERISVNAQPKRRRPHKRTHKRINKLVDVEMQGFMPQQETFPWTDAEIDFFIDQEEGPPLPDEMYEPYGDFYDTDDEE